MAGSSVSSCQGMLTPAGVATNCTSYVWVVFRSAAVRIGQESANSGSDFFVGIVSLALGDHSQPTMKRLQTNTLADKLTV